MAFNGTPEELTLLGKAFTTIPRKSLEDQDARGFNKALDAVWRRYEELRHPPPEMKIIGFGPRGPITAPVKE